MFGKIFLIVSADDEPRQIVSRWFVLMQGKCRECPIHRQMPLVPTLNILENCNSALPNHLALQSSSHYLKSS